MPSSTKSTPPRDDLRTINRRHIDLVLRAVRSGRRRAIAEAIAALRRSEWGAILPARWLKLTEKALKTGKYDLLSGDFRSLQFLGDGYFLIVAPYTLNRGGRPQTKLSALFGRTLPHTFPELRPTIQAIFGRSPAFVSRVIPIETLDGAGNVGPGAHFEAFIVPDGWAFHDSAHGPPLNDMKEQLNRFERFGRQAVCRVFDEPSAELLLSSFAVAGPSLDTRILEYAFHDGGHSTGRGLPEKIFENVLNGPWIRAVEEWRADGVSFELASRILSPAVFGTLVASNLCTRFGVDALRKGGPQLDTDVNVARLTFHHLLGAGALAVGKDGRLTLKATSLSDLGDAVSSVRKAAVALTHEELLLDSTLGIHVLYGTRVGIPRDVEDLFSQLVLGPCADLAAGLQ
jgi:hypothetical protein